jgi:hypothetical protein
VVALALAGCSRKIPYAVPVLNNLKIPVIAGVCTDAACKQVKGSVILGPGDGYNQPADGTDGAVTWIVLRHPYGGRIGCLRSVSNGKSTGTLIRASHYVACP